MAACTPQLADGVAQGSAIRSGGVTLSATRMLLAGPDSALAGARFRGRHEAPRHAEEVPESIGVDAGQSHENRWITHVMILQVVDFWIGSQQLLAADEIDADYQGFRLSGAVG